MPSVSMPPEFFRSEMRLYDDWRLAFNRELLQNALDARATRIDVSFHTVTAADGSTQGRVVFADDGTGMSRRVLEGVFFALGRTTKTGPDTVGGFGRARMLVCFAQHAYRIETQDLAVSGVGGDYEITESATGAFRCGTEFTIDLVDATPDRVRSAMVRLLGGCDLPVPVYLDGVLEKPASRPGRARRVLRDSNNVPWASVYVDPSVASRMVVRVSGLEMFTRWISGSAHVVVELRPSRSRDVLAASRNSLVAEFSEQLDKFISDLSSNRRRAWRPDSVPLNIAVYGGGVMVSAPKTTTDGAGTGDDQDAAVIAGADGSVLVESSSSRIGGILRPSRLVSGSVPATSRGTLAGTRVEDPDPGRLGFDVHLAAQVSDARSRRLAREWNPVAWPVSGGRRRGLVLTWRAAVQVCLDALLVVRPDLGALAWTVGWTFDEDVVAHHTRSGEVHVFSLNPVRSGTRMVYRVSDRADRARILAAAAHEVCHVAGSEHDEGFASLLTEVFASIDQRAAASALTAAVR